MTKDYWLYCNFFSTYVWHLFFLERVLNLVIFLYVNNIPNIKNDNRHKYSSSSSKPFPINLELALSLSVLFCPSLLYPVTLFPVCLSASSHINDSLSYLYRASSGCHMPKLFSNDILWFFSFIDFFFFFDRLAVLIIWWKDVTKEVQYKTQLPNQKDPESQQTAGPKQRHHHTYK